MKLEPLEQWICDACGEVIETPGDGYLEWLSGDDHKAHSFRIVHHAPKSPRKPGGDCYAYTKASGRMDLDLDAHVGPSGLPHLLTFLDAGEYHQRDYQGPEVRNVREWVELFRRLQLPYYEEARLYWGRAREAGYRRLMKLNSRAFLETPSNDAPHLKLAWLAGETDGISLASRTAPRDCPPNRAVVIGATARKNIPRE